MNRFKFPRTPHLSWSPGFTSDDIRLKDFSRFEIMREVVVTEKLDGENTTIYSDGYIHARSIDSDNHPSRNWVKRELVSKAYELPEGWRICGENVYAIHSIEYNSLPTFFFVFAVIDDTNTCLSWDDTKEFVEVLGLQTVPLLYRGHWDEDRIRQCMRRTSSFGTAQEGYVVRNAGSFPMNEYAQNVAKYVRKGHVQTDEHWTKNWKPAKLKEE